MLKEVVPSMTTDRAAMIGTSSAGGTLPPTQNSTLLGGCMVAEAEEEDERDRHDMTLPSMPEKRHQAVITGNAMVVPSINPVLPKAVRNDSVSTIQWEAPPSNYYKQNPGLVSSCSGQKKALLVGIVYRGSEKVLEGCINDTTIMKKFLVQKFNFNPADIRVLSEDMADTSLHPTRANIIAGFNWLVAGTQPGDSLVFQYSGHGGQISDLDGDESDGLDELIFPLDHKDAGVIIDDEMNRFLVRNLPRGVRLTAIFDCCHSGSALDLPFTYAPNGRIKENTPMAKLSRMAKGTTSLLMRGNVKRAMTRIQDGFKQLKIRAQSQNEKVATKGSLVADVILFAGCKDSETSSDAKINGKATGAMTYALTKVLKEGATPTYGVLLNKIRRILAEHFSQTPQISSARYMDMSQPFIM